MHYPTRLPKALLALLATALFAATIEGFGGASKKVLLQNVQTLTLRKDKLTSHRRVSAIPQVRPESTLSAPIGQPNILTLAEMRWRQRLSILPS
jgi:SOCE-associated regulatory factor of calcium homoeostasis